MHCQLGKIGSRDKKFLHPDGRQRFAAARVVFT
jgi:hypothetical protein